MTDEEGSENLLVDGSNDRYYFTMIPNIVDEIGLSVVAFRLYFHIKRVAGEIGECYQSSRTLAEKCSISNGSVTNAKKELLDNQLITISKVRGDKGLYDVIRITDIWKRNIEYFTKSNKDERTPDEQVDAVDTTENIPPPVGVRTPDEQLRSPGEQLRTPDEQLRTPGETKKNPIKNNPIKNNYIGVSKEKTPMVRSDELQGFYLGNQNPRKLDCSHFPQDIRAMVQKFCDLWKISPPPARIKREFAWWIAETRKLMTASDEFGVQALEKAYYTWLQHPFTVAHPGALVNTVTAEVGNMRRTHQPTADNPLSTIQSDRAEAIAEFQKRQWEKRHPTNLNSPS